MLCFSLRRGDRAPSSHRSPAVVNPRHRRSLSQGADNGAWVDHQPGPQVTLATLFKPKIKGKKISVAKLEAEDVSKGSK